MRKAAASGLFTPRYAVTVALTAHGPALEVHRQIMGLRFRVGEDTFARVASLYADAQPTSRPRRAAAVAPNAPQLAGGASALVVPAVVHDVGRPSLFGRRARLTSRPPTLWPRAKPTTSAALHEHASDPSPAWSARCAEMAKPSTWAETPEVQVTAHLLGSPIRVFTRDAEGTFKVRFQANPNGARAALDVVLDNNHYRWIRGGHAGDTFRDGDEVATRIQNVPGDGACFFHCVTEGLRHAPKASSNLRARVVKLVLRNERMPLDGAGGMTLGDAFPAS